MTAEQKWFLQPVSVPLQKEPLDPASAQAGAEAVVAKTPRTFEVFWDGSDFGLCFGAPALWDLDLTLRLYRQHVKVGLSPAPERSAPGSKEGTTEYPVPPWLTKLDPSSTRFFFVGNERGHCFAVFDTRKTGLLMTPLLITLQRSRFAWVQFEWFEADLRGPLGDLRYAMAHRYKVIDSGYISPSAYLFYDNPAKTEHPAKGGDFYVHYPRLKEHIEAKETSSLVAMVVRGVVDTGGGGMQQLPFGIVEDAGEVRRGRWLGPSPAQSLGGDAKLGDRLVAWWTGDPRMLLDMVQRRALDVRGPMASYVKDYLPRRHSLPFVILGKEEMGLLVHLPSSDLRGLKTTRGSELPQPSANRMMEKQGIQIAGT
jgi:hypothetical protein